MIVLRTLGTAEIDTGIVTITPSQEMVFAAALYLTLERGNRVSRKHLASLLWPRVGEKARGHRLRQTIHQLKKLGVLVTADRDNLYLSAHGVRSDADILPSADPLDVVTQQSLEFLPGYSPRFSESLRDWVDSKRDLAHAAATAVLVRELERHRLQGDWATVEKLAAKCLSLDEFNETAVLAQAEAAAMRGGKLKAVSILDRYIAEVGISQTDLRLPATLLRRRVVERIPERPALLNVDPPFVGREPEMEVLTKKFNDARNGKGGGVLLIGEPGVGKTRLSTELARFAELQGARVQRATCRRADIDRPLSLFVDIVPQLRDMPGALGCDPETFSWLNRLTEFEQRGGDTSRQIDAESLFQHVRAALFDLLDCVAEERCLVVLIEDIQWLDNASATILMRMVEWSASRRLFFLVNSRVDRNAFLEYAEKATLDTLRLGPLKATASTALLTSIALRPGDAPPPEFINWCLAVAEGNAFFLQELARQWIETGQRYEAPPSVTKVLQERLSRLSEEALQVLQACAILGEHATLDRVEQVLKYRPHQILSAVEELNKGAMLGVNADRNGSLDSLLQPRHDFLASAAISRLAPLSLAFIHRRSADALESEIVHEKMPARLLWACASHRHHAGDRDRALSLSMSCAEHLLELGLTGEASIGFQRSLEYCVSDAQRLKLLPRLALSFELDGDWEKSKQALVMCTQLFIKQDPSNSQHNEYELLLLDVRHRSALDFANLLEETLPCVGSSEAPAQHRVGAAVLAMKLAMDFGQMECVDWIYEQVSPVLYDQSVSECDRLELQIIYRTDRGDGFVPLEDLQLFADAARVRHGEVGYSRALVTASTACRHSARYHEGLAFVLNASDHAKTNRLPSRRVEITISALLLHLAAGKIAEAGEALRELERYPKAAGNSKIRNEIQIYIATLALANGDLSRAVSVFESVDRPSSTFSVTRKGYYLALEIRIRLQQGMTHIIWPLVAELEEHHCRMRASGVQDFESYALYLGLCAVGERSRGLTLLRDYVKHRRSKWPLPPEVLQDLHMADEETPIVSVTGYPARHNGSEHQ
ncbi:MAG: AAA family ATPase [Gemmatimonadaceae bacterium]